MNNDKLLKALDKFRKEIDKELKGETPKLTGGMDTAYDCDIYIYRHPGMGNSKQFISGNTVSIYTATASYLETLIKNKIIGEDQLRDLVEMSISAANGKFESE